jgi:hypothetical protein
MPYQENRRGRRPSDNDPRIPVALTPELADFLRTQPVYACIAQGTSEGTAFLIKTPARAVATLRGTMPVGIRHELYAHPAAPVIRTVLTIVDRPDAPLTLETFCNVAAPDQRADFAALAEHEDFLLLFYDEELRHRLSKRVPYPQREDVPMILARAEAIRAAIPPPQFNFDRAKTAVIQQTTL